MLEYSQRIPKPGGLLSGRERNAAITDAKLEVLALVLRVVLADKGSLHPYKRLILLSNWIGWPACGTTAFVADRLYQVIHLQAIDLIVSSAIRHKL
ncbi:hypothetical protein [Bradyrhizobium sp. CW7]|uniref:hypothetical protein n=1 Tax=Bradyrhizobium sp. CW7 TaxID=2782688 RepID=UPI001FFBF285|nr:hypothetical protein [Bradyrhizobium sp. CW7]